MHNDRAEVLAKLDTLLKLRIQKERERGMFSPPPHVVLAKPPLGHDVPDRNYLEQVPLPVKPEPEDQIAIKPTLIGPTDEIVIDEDPPELFYYSNYTSIEALVKNRYEWDRYVVQPGTVGGSSIPIHFIEPPQPQAQSKWKNYLKEPLVEINPQVVNLIF